MPRTAKLGASEHRTTITPLALVAPGGGLVLRTLIRVQRKYPLHYWRKLPSGRTCVLTPKAHNRAVTDVETQTLQIEEDVSARIQAEEVARCAAQLKSTSTPKDQRLYAEAVVAGSNALGNSQPQADRHLAERQAILDAQKHQRILFELQSAGVTDLASSQTCIDILVSAVCHEDLPYDMSSSQEAIIRLWRPPEDLQAMREGSIFSVTHLSPSKMLRCGMLVLNTTVKTQWQEKAARDGSKLVSSFRPRVTSSLAQVGDMAAGSDFDFHGILVNASEVQEGDSYCTQWLFLADASVRDAEDWLLAVHLKAGKHAVDFVDPIWHTGGFLVLKDVRVEHCDVPNALRRASANENSQIVAATGQAKGRFQELAEWQKENKVLMKALHARTQLLLSG